MPLTPLFLPTATTDLEDSAAWYEARSAGLGDVFQAAVEEAIRQAAYFPESHPVSSKDCRIISLRRFPFHIFYRIDGDRLVVQAVLHMRRGDAARPDHP
jgi:plasmid stabilization system protein ParE